MEAKARAIGSDSLEKLLTSWMSMAEDPGLDLNNNAGRKYRDLQKRCATGPVVVWLVTEETLDSGPETRPGPDIQDRRGRPSTGPGAGSERDS